MKSLTCSICSRRWNIETPDVIRPSSFICPLCVCQQPNCQNPASYIMIPPGGLDSDKQASNVYNMSVCEDCGVKLVLEYAEMRGESWDLTRIEPKESGRANT